MDVLEKLGHWNIHKDNRTHHFMNEKEMKSWILSGLNDKEINVYFSGDKEKI